MTRPRIIIDCETTGLDPELHQIWELATLDRASGAEHVWRMKPDLAKADPGALRVGKFYERTARMRHAAIFTNGDEHPVFNVAVTTETGAEYWSHPRGLAAFVARKLDDATVIAANPAFDAGFLTAFLRANGQAPTWHYRLRDIGSMAYAYLSACLALGVEGRDAAKGVPAMDASTDDFARTLGVDPEKFERHSALGNCRLVAAMLRVIDGGAA